MRSNLAAVSFAISVGFIALYPNPAKAEINLIGSRWSEHEIDFVYCNDGKGPAEIFSITAGEFRPSISKVSPGDCIQRRFFSNEHKHIFHVMRDKEIKVLTFSHSNETLLSDSTVKGALLFLSGFIVSGLQGALGSLISHPIRILRLAYFRRKAVALLKERVDDAGKNVTLPAELVACRSAGGVEAISLPIWLVRRIDRLCDAYDDWKREKPLKPETRSLIAGL